MTKTTSEYDTVETVLKYDSVKDTLKDFVEDVKQLALLSNSDKNSFKAITSKEDVDNMIKADTTTKVGESAFLSVRALNTFLRYSEQYSKHVQFRDQAFSLHIS